MPENTQPQDGSRIDVKDHYELQYWSQKFGTTPYLLRQAVAIVGASAKTVEAYIRTCRTLGPLYPNNGRSSYTRFSQK